MKNRRQIIDVVVALVVALVLVYSKPLMKKTKKNEIDVVVDLVLVYNEPLDLMKKTKN